VDETGLLDPCRCCAVHLPVHCGEQSDIVQRLSDGSRDINSWLDSRRGEFSSKDEPHDGAARRPSFQKTWRGALHDFHGRVTSSSSRAKEVRGRIGVASHSRTKMRGQMSFISSAVCVLARMLLQRGVRGLYHLQAISSQTLELPSEFSQFEFSHTPSPPTSSIL
jgi:hypothetical protein